MMIGFENLRQKQNLTKSSVKHHPFSDIFITIKNYQYSSTVLGKSSPSHTREIR